LQLLALLLYAVSAVGNILLLLAAVLLLAFQLLVSVPAVAGALLLLSPLPSRHHIQPVSVKYGTLKGCSSMGLVFFMISDHRAGYSINYRSIGYRTKASVLLPENLRAHLQLSV
jgi:hypothetical protein